MNGKSWRGRQGSLSAGCDPQRPLHRKTSPSFPPPGSLAAPAPKKHAFLPRMLRAGASRDWLHRPHVMLGWRRRLPGRQLEKWRLSGLREGVRGGAAGKRVPRRGRAVPEPAAPGREGAGWGPRAEDLRSPWPEGKPAWQPLPNTPTSGRPPWALPQAWAPGGLLDKPRAGPAASRK